MDFSLSWVDIVAIVGAIISIASVIVKMTPNETDNKLLASFIKFWEKIAMNTDPVKPKSGSLN